MARFARLNDPDPRIRAKLQVALYYARKNRKDKLNASPYGEDVIFNSSWNLASGVSKNGNDFTFISSPQNSISSVLSLVVAGEDYYYEISAIDLTGDEIVRLTNDSSSLVSLSESLTFSSGIFTAAPTTQLRLQARNSVITGTINLVIRPVL